jgi:hypothetical protein
MFFRPYHFFEKLSRALSPDLGTLLLEKALKEDLPSLYNHSENSERKGGSRGMFEDILTFLTFLLQGIRRSRLKTLSWLIAGLLRGSDWPEKRTLNSLIRTIPRKVSFEAKKKQFFRFLKNQAFTLESFTEALWLGIVQRIPPNSQVPVIIDWVTKGDWALLGASLPSSLGRALVFAEVLCLRRELTLAQNQIELAFIRYLKRLFENVKGLGIRFIIVADRGFGKSNLMEPILKGLEFIFRTPGKVIFYPEGTGKPILLGRIARKLVPGEVWEGKGLVHQTKKLFFRVIIVGGEDPWILLTNIWDIPAEKIISIYAQRSLIEESFRDFQKGVLGFLKLLGAFVESGRKAKWLILGIIGHWVSMKLGEALEKMGELKEITPRPWKKLKEKGYKRVLAISRLGTLAIRLGIGVKGWGKLEGWGPFFFQTGFT